MKIFFLDVHGTKSFGIQISCSVLLFSSICVCKHVPFCRRELLFFKIYSKHNVFYASAFRATAKNIQRMLLLLLLSYTTHSDCYFGLAGFDSGTRSLHGYDIQTCDNGTRLSTWNKKKHGEKSLWVQPCRKLKKTWWNAMMIFERTAV